MALEALHFNTTLRLHNVLFIQDFYGNLFQENNSLLQEITFQSKQIPVQMTLTTKTYKY